MTVISFDHLVLTVSDVSATCTFYTSIYLRDPDGNLIELACADGE